MKATAQTLLAATLFFLFCAALFFFGLVVPRLALSVAGYRPEWAGYLILYLLLLYGTALLLFSALWAALRFLAAWRKGRGISLEGGMAVQGLQRRTRGMGLLQGLALPLVYVFGDVEDAPGIILVSLLVLGATLVVWSLTVLHQELLQAAQKGKA